MRKSPVLLCSLLTAVTLHGQDNLSSSGGISSEQSLQPVQILPPEEPAPIAPPTVEVIEPSQVQPAVPGTVTAPVQGPVPAVPGVVAPPSAGGTVYAVEQQTLTIPGRTVSEFSEEPVGAVLRLLARQAGVNMVVSDLVQGTVTMRLEGLTPLEAIRVVVTAKGLIIDQIDSVYYIKTPAEKQREPTESGHYTFSYATAEKVIDLLRSQIQSGVAPQFDPRTNTVYYRDFKSNMENIQLFLESIDRPTQQVMIEARLVEVNATPKQSYGINWSGVLGGADAGKTFNFAGAQTVVSDGAGGTTAVLGDFLFRGKAGATASALAGQYAILSAPAMSATLRLLNEDTDTEFLANPRVVTANNLEARIEITRNQPVPQLNFNEQTATSVFGGFEDKTFGNTLVVRPTINKDNFVTMMVKPTISNKVDDAVYRFGGAEVTSPIIDERSLESTVLIKSGDTLAIGGLLQDESIKRRSKVPVLGDIPILGYAFQERMNERRKRNLLVFVTPTIIKQGYGTGLEDQVSGLKYSGEEFSDPNGWRNNARGAVRLVPTAQRQNVQDYPKPGRAPAPEKRYKVRPFVRPK